MTDIVADASVIVKWYIPERDHRNARVLRDDHLDGNRGIIAPALLPFEVINALKYSGHFSRNDLQHASVTLPDYGIDLVPYANLGAVTTISSDLDITIYDAAYVALAQTRQTKAYTADNRLLEAIDGTAYADLAAHIRVYPE